jgi:DNA repair protein RecO (recombination protein O)
MARPIGHLYSATRGRIGAIAKGSRRPKSRFGGRLEPFFRLNLVLYEGRGDLFTVTGASTVDGHGTLRSNGPALGSAGRACDAVLRLLDDGDPNEAAYNLLCTYLALLDADPTSASAPGAALAFRLKLALAAGFSPELASCASCGEADHIAAFSGSAGGVVCASCEGGGFPFSEEAHRFMVDALARPLSDAPAAERGVAAQADRAITETLDHHAHVHLRAAA